MLIHVDDCIIEGSIDFIRSVFNGLEKLWTVKVVGIICAPGEICKNQIPSMRCLGCELRVSENGYSMDHFFFLHR